ncbi:Erythronate-4-phosphate dehydrogenase [BD1-7 clade bacterium]|uniref:Erythronate-4-phosphate dehydrogenase n=1 Tax=BD1-7 clade bacterium TaxID=2029982 RepID=A0A5S9R0V1_9GAMM|nr:Erythronate-4-phosphate dehydrogenase [BD1-7 clade bacterium]
MSSLKIGVNIRLMCRSYSEHKNGNKHSKQISMIVDKDDPMSSRLRIVADENIPSLQAYLADCADVKWMPGRQIQSSDLVDCDVLLVRSVTKVDADLLAGTPVKFVGSCTIGLDHLDLTYIADAGIGYAHAPGCNADAVVDYVLAAMFAFQPDLSVWTDKSIGIVGLGNVGSALQSRLTALGIKTLAYDPFKDAATSTFEKVMNADVVTLHVPLTTDGTHPTLKMIGPQQIEGLRDGVLLINTCRGKVIDNTALALHLNRLYAVLDVYDEEPQPADELLDQLFIATSHIAGYSMQGKLRGTEMVVRALSDYFDLGLTLPDLLGDYRRDIVIDVNDVSELVRRGYDIKQDSATFNASYKAVESLEKADFFDRYRREYPLRVDFSYQSVAGAALWPNDEPSKLGFNVSQTNASD